MTDNEDDTKFGQAKIITSKATEDTRQPLLHLFFFFCVLEHVDITGYSSSISIRSIMEDELTPPYKGEVNGQVERSHFTLGEIMRCLKRESPSRNFEELLQRTSLQEEINLNIYYLF